jgi:hypothetical protein
MVLPRFDRCCLDFDEPLKSEASVPTCLRDEPHRFRPFSGGTPRLSPSRVIIPTLARVAGCALGSALPHCGCTKGNQRNIRTEAAIPPKQTAKRRVNLRRR